MATEKTPDLYVQLFNGTYQGTGQCVAGFQHFCNWLGYPTIRTGNNCAWNYGKSASKSAEIQKYFYRIDSIGQMQNGDWYISDATSSNMYGHVAMYYKGESFGQNQYGSGGGYKYTSRPFSIWKSQFICAYRAKAWGNASFGSTGGKSAGFRTYQLSEDQLRGIAALCEEEQGSAIGAASEASLLANRFELYGASRGQSTIWATASSSWFAAKSRARLYAKNPSTSVYNAVKDVLVNGNRRLPNYIDEHDYVGDIGRISTGNYLNAGDFIPDRTEVYQNSNISGGGGHWTFYCWGDESRIKNGKWGGLTDPFGYSKTAKSQATKLGLNGTVGGGTVGGGGGYAPLYSTMNDRNDATLRESAYMDDKGEQTLTDTKIPLSVINYTPVLANMYSQATGTSVDGSTVDLSGIPVSNTTMQGKVNTSKITPPLAKEIFDHLFKKGGLPAAICGILGNLYQECKYDSSLIEKTSSPTKGAGLCQWTNSRGSTRRTRFEQHVPNWTTSGVGPQLDYMIWEIYNPDPVSDGSGRYKHSIKLWEGQISIPGNISTYGVGQYVKAGPLENSEAGAIAACCVWLANHEGPSAAHAMTEVRIKETRRIWNLLQFIN